MKKALSAAAVAAACCVPFAASAQAAAAPAKAEPEFTIAGNAGLFSDYRFRGFSQTDYKPAFQGGVDFAHKSGFYAGNWNSNVSSVLYNGASLEMDFYGGYKTTIGDFGLDVGTIYYYYPGTGAYIPEFEAKNWEVYIGGSYGPVSLKYYYSFTDFFGLNSEALGLPGGIDTKGSQYLDLSGTYDLGGGWGLVGHVGWQSIKNAKDLGLRRRQRLRLQARRDLRHLRLGLDRAAPPSSARAKRNCSLKSDLSEGAGKTSVVVSVTKTF